MTYISAQQSQVLVRPRKSLASLITQTTSVRLADISAQFTAPLRNRSLRVREKFAPVVHHR